MQYGAAAVAFDVVVVGFIIPLAVLFMAVLGARRAKTRWVGWGGWIFAILAVLWMAASLYAIVACC